MKERISDEVRDLVIELRKQGMTYPLILSIFKMSKSTLSSICREAGLGKPLPTKSIEEENKDSKCIKLDNCVVCGKELTGNLRIYCSKECKNLYYKNELYHSDYSRKKDAHGLYLKCKLILAKGGCCEICGYNKNIAALQFHHINPSEKLFTLDARTIERMSDDEVIKEFNKCKLLCSNCHAELHNPDYILDNYQKFRELSSGIKRRANHELSLLDVGE